MRGLETISTTRRNGRGPDSSLKRLWVFVWIRVYTVAALWIVTHFGWTFEGSVIDDRWVAQAIGERRYWELLRKILDSPQFQIQWYAQGNFSETLLELQLHGM